MPIRCAPPKKKAVPRPFWSRADDDRTWLVAVPGTRKPRAKNGKTVVRVFRRDGRTSNVELGDKVDVIEFEGTKYTRFEELVKSASVFTKLSDFDPTDLEFLGLTEYDITGKSF